MDGLEWQLPAAEAGEGVFPWGHGAARGRGQEVVRGEDDEVLIAVDLVRKIHVGPRLKEYMQAVEEHARGGSSRACDEQRMRAARQGGVGGWWPPRMPSARTGGAVCG